MDKVETEINANRYTGSAHILEQAILRNVNKIVNENSKTIEPFCGCEIL